MDLMITIRTRGGKVLTIGHKGTWPTAVHVAMTEHLVFAGTCDPMESVRIRRGASKHYSETGHEGRDW